MLLWQQIHPKQTHLQKKWTNSNIRWWMAINLDSLSISYFLSCSSGNWSFLLYSSFLRIKILTTVWDETALYKFYLIIAKSRYLFFFFWDHRLNKRGRKERGQGSSSWVLFFLSQLALTRSNFPRKRLECPGMSDYRPGRPSNFQFFL